MSLLLRKFKTSIRRLTDGPLGVRRGANVSVQRPFSINGRKYISIGFNTSIRHNSYLSAIDSYGSQHFIPNIDIGSNVYIGSSLYIAAIGEISIGDMCVLSDHVYITDVFHGMHPDHGLIMEQPLESKGPVKIGHSCFLGYRCAIMPGVTLGEHCVVGTNSVVTRSFPAHSMIVGAPARLIKTFDLEKREWVTVSE